MALSRKRPRSEDNSEVTMGAEQSSASLNVPPAESPATSPMQVDSDAEVEDEQQSEDATQKLQGESLLQAHVKRLKALFGSDEHPVIKRFKQGDSDGIYTFKLPNKKGKRFLLFNLMLMDTPKYGAGHQNTVWADEDLPEEQQELCDGLPERNLKTLDEVLRFMVRGLCGLEALATVNASLGGSDALPTTTEDMDGSGSDTDEDLGSDLGDGDDAFGLNVMGTSGVGAAMNKDLSEALRRDFIGIREAGYRPGFMRMSDGSKVISISVPVSRLNIPVTALHAWDGKLLDPKMRLVLLMSFQDGYPKDSYTEDEILAFLSRRNVRYVVGLSHQAKPSETAIFNAFKQHSSVSNWTPLEFEPFSLSRPLAEQLKDCFGLVFAYRRASKTPVSWAVAEELAITQGGKVNGDPKAAEREEADMGVPLPADPLLAKAQRENIPLCAFIYLIRRFAMCPRNCLICHRKVENVAMRPYVCHDPLCSFQYMNLGLGPEIEFEILHNRPVADLLVSLAYISAAENELPQHPPEGMGIMVPTSTADVKHHDRWVDLDTLQDKAKNNPISLVINLIPSVELMQKWLNADDLPEHKKATARARKLIEMGEGVIHPSVWLILRWIIASNTSYIREIDDGSLTVRNVPPMYRQFVFISGAPEKENKLKRAVQELRKTDSNAETYPTLYAFHGSQVKNWHSILRQGLHFKKTTNGRAYGNGVYFALDGNISLGTYAQPTMTSWKASEYPPATVAALCEVLNCPTKFVSSRPYLVVQETDWIVTRYLMVKRTTADEVASSTSTGPVSTIPIDPRYAVTHGGQMVAIPDLRRKLRDSYLDQVNKLPPLKDEYSMADQAIFERTSTSLIDVDAQKATEAQRAKWAAERASYKPFAPELIERNLVRTLPPPRSATSAASLAIGRELKNMMKIQEEQSPQSLGFYFDPDFTNDNLFHWVVELLGFDPEIPLAKDMQSKGVKGILLEILFPQNYPFLPPFVRVIHPRVLPFAQGGGGHVTAGGSICMDLLTTNGWSSSYTIEAILMQIRMAMSNLEPRPARLSSNDQWNIPYNIGDAIEGFKRAARTHGWQIPADLDKLALGTFI